MSTTSSHLCACRTIRYSLECEERAAIMGSDARRQLGKAGEEMAARLLSAEGLTIIARNWRCSHGELDLVAEEVAPDLSNGGALITWLVIVEVRIRRGSRFGTAQASVTATKQAK